ncbi:hypothetical protein KUCAC02_026993, partial [Chaenocephalus aceratus]
CPPLLPPPQQGASPLPHPPCPPCRQPGQRPRPRCTHTCPLPCHDLVTVKSQQVRLAGPWEQPSAPAFVQKALPCAPCAVPIPTACFGDHEVSSVYLQIDHFLFDDVPKTSPSIILDWSFLVQSAVWTTSDLRESHLQSGVSPGYPRQQVRARCYCRIIVLFIDCTKWTSADAKTKGELGSCNNQCPKECDDACKDQKKKVSQVKEAELKAAQEEEQKKLQRSGSESRSMRLP